MILHCFSAGPAWAERAAERGWYCSFAGNLTYPKSEPIREAAALVADDRLLVVQALGVGEADRRDVAIAAGDRDLQEAEALGPEVQRRGAADRGARRAPRTLPRRCASWPGLPGRP